MRASRCSHPSHSLGRYFTTSSLKWNELRSTRPSYIVAPDHIAPNLVSCRATHLHHDPPHHALSAGRTRIYEKSPDVGRQASNPKATGEESQRRCHRDCDHQRAAASNNQATLREASFLPSRESSSIPTTSGREHQVIHGNHWTPNFPMTSLRDDDSGGCNKGTRPDDFNLDNRTTRT